MSAQRHQLADELFVAGKFSEAEPIFRESIDTLPVAAQRLGQIALLANRCDEAQQWFGRVVADSPFFPAAQHALGELYYRRGDYAQAARYFHSSGRVAMAEKLASFGAAPPYEAVGVAAETELALVATAPLPVVRVQVNGIETHMVLDTGTGETLLDIDFAEGAAAAANGFETKIFGGQTGVLRHGRVDRLRIGAAELGNVPVQIGGVRGVFAPFFSVPIEGIIGVGLLRRFFVTLDVPGARLVLRQGPLPRPDARTAMPFWLTDDEHLIAWGSINDRYPVLMSIDTGQTGFHFAAPPSTVQAAQLPLEERLASYGPGGGGAINGVPFALDRVALGGAAVHNAHGALEPRFPLERRYGFRIGGLLAYDFFRQFVVSFDFAAMRLYLPAATADATIVQK